MADSQIRRQYLFHYTIYRLDYYYLPIYTLLQGQSLRHGPSEKKECEGQRLRRGPK